jgi:hypothetical protein
VTSVQVYGPVGPKDLLPNRHLAFAVEEGTEHSIVASSIASEKSAETVAVLAKAKAAELATYAAYGTPALAELKEAVQASD